jgi:hypothetical protein
MQLISIMLPLSISSYASLLKRPNATYYSVAIINYKEFVLSRVV